MVIQNINNFEGTINISSKSSEPVGQFQDYIKDLIGRAKIKEALSELETWAHENNRIGLKSDIALFKATLASLNREKTLGLLGSSEAGTQQNQLTYSILEFIDNLSVKKKEEEEEDKTLTGFISRIEKKYQDSKWSVNFYDLCEPIAKKIKLSQQLSIEEVESFKQSVKDLELEIETQTSESLRKTQRQDLNSILLLLQEEVPTHEQIEEAFDFLILFMSNWPKDIGVRLVIAEQERFNTDPVIAMRRKYNRYSEYTPGFKTYIVEIVNRIIVNNF
jgi:hypothetical protein